MPRVRITVEGAERAAQALRDDQRRLEKPLRPLLEAVAAEWTGRFKEHVLSGGAPGSTWPPLARKTRALRRRRGHAPGRPLIRRGDLLHSITLLDAGESWVEVGTRHEIAAIVHEGGTEEAPYNVPGRREIPARPFIELTPLEVEDTFGLIADYFFEEAA